MKIKEGGYGNNRNVQMYKLISVFYEDISFSFVPADICFQVMPASEICWGLAKQFEDKYLKVQMKKKYLRRRTRRFNTSGIEIYH
jgi:hypothetical protein